MSTCTPTRRAYGPTPEQMAAASEGVDALTENFRKFRDLEKEALGLGTPAAGHLDPAKAVAEVSKAVEETLKLQRDAEDKASSHLDRYYQWTYTQRSQILSYWSESDTKKREATALALSTKKNVAAKEKKDATDKVRRCKLDPSLKAPGFKV